MSYLQSARVFWRVAPAPSRGAGTRPCSVSGPSQAQGSPPAAPPYAYAHSRAPGDNRIVLI